MLQLLYGPRSDRLGRKRVLLAAWLGSQLHVRLGWQANFVLMAVLAVLLWAAARRGCAITGRRADRSRSRSPTG